MTPFQIIIIFVLLALLVILFMRKKGPKEEAQLARVAGAWFDKSQPLWLPQGTVRALVVLGLTYAIVVILLKSILLETDVPPGVAQYMRELTPAVVLIIKGYIDSRATETNQSPKT